MNYNSYKYEDNEGSGCALWVAGAIGAFILFMVYVSAVQVSDLDAIARFKELIPDANSITIITDSGNDNPIVHQMDDVTFELNVVEDNGSRRVSGRCTNGLFRDMVCRVYTGGE